MTGHERALVASIAKLRGAGYTKAATDLQNELNRLRASSAKPKKPAPPVVTVVDPDDDDEDEDEPTEIVLGPRDPKPRKTKTLGGVTFEAPDLGEPEHVHMLGKPTPREQFAKALGMPSHVAATFTDAELTAVAPSFVAMAKRNR